MLRWMLIVPLLVTFGPLPGPAAQVPPVQNGQFFHSEVADWLLGVFNGLYVEGGDLRLQPEQTGGTYESQPLQTPFGLNAAVLQWNATATSAQTVTLELRSSVDAQSWTEWQTASAQPAPDGASISHLFVLRPFTSWLQYRVRLESVEGSPALANVRLTYL